MREMSKAVVRWSRDRRYATRYLVGDGLDVGAGNDPVAQYWELFPLMASCRPWDTAYGDGDGAVLEGVADASLDFVVSAHCLEHVTSPLDALANWLRVLKPGGHLIVIVPDEDRYEQGVWPSTHNGDHKFTFTIAKRVRSWSPVSRNLVDMLGHYREAEILKIEVLDEQHLYCLPRTDQTLGIGEGAIEIILRKRTAGELDAGGRLPPTVVTDFLTERLTKPKGEG